MSVKTIQSYKEYQKKKPNIRHNTTQIFLKCPECLLYSKNPQRVKTHKNLSSLDSHFSTNHKDESWVDLAKILIRQFAEVLK